MKRPGKTPPFVDAHGHRLPRSIAETAFVRIGGIDQWVMLRGEDVANPPLVLVHGGPGFSETVLFRHHNAALEKSFTVVYWDQRGAGKSADPAIPRSTMTVERFIADLDELIDTVLARLVASRVVLFGHSWGSALGILYAQRYPGKVAAYVGSGQIGDWPFGESLSYAYALGEAERQGNEKGLAALRAIGPPPHDDRQLWTERTWLQRMDGRFSAKSLWQMAHVILGSREASLRDLARAYRGFRTSLRLMWPEVSRLNLVDVAPVLQVPVFFFLGRNDHWVPPEASVQYFDALTAPAKQIVWFEASGHEPFADEAEKFNAAMVDLVRPVAVERAGR